MKKRYWNITMIETAILLLLAALFISRPKGMSMYPFKRGYFGLSLATPFYRELNRGDVVEIRSEVLGLIEKRIVGLPGERVSISDEQIFINGEALEEAYAYFDPEAKRRYVNMEEVILGENEYFVVGDNRRGSDDSRLLLNSRYPGYEEHITADKITKKILKEASAETLANNLLYWIWPEGLFQ